MKICWFLCWPLDKILTVAKSGRKSAFLIVTVVVLSALLVSNHVVRMKRQDELLSGKMMDSPICLHPDLPLDDPSIMKYIVNVDRISCDETTTDWVEVNGTHAFVTNEAKEKHEGPIVCRFYEIERINDDLTKLSEKITQGHWYKFEDVDFVEVSCTARREKWMSFFASPRDNVFRSAKKVMTGSHYPSMNILMLGHDSLSRNMFIRKLPLTYEYLTKDLQGKVLQGYNIVGDGTPQALIPILTGKTEQELPEARKRKGSRANYVDVYPFVWKEYSNKGYLTGYMEDAPGLGTFTYRLKGFKDPPTDFYMRNYFTHAQGHYSKYPKYCIGSVPRHRKVLDYIKHILNMRKEVPKFLFAFHNELSHDDSNSIEGADFDLKEFLQDIHVSGILNSTILIIMSDHGHRFASFRETLQGKQEERMPIFMFVFPSWFQDLYPSAYTNFLINTKRLSTPFDIHATLQDILHLEKISKGYFPQSNPNTDRQMSLFREIPVGRTCASAKIEPHWCACLQWSVIKTDSTIAQWAALEFISYLNDLTLPQREFCSELELGKVLWAAHLHPTDELVRFRQSKDEDGIKADLSDHTATLHAVIQLKVEAIPGKGHFEVSMIYDLASYEFKIKETDISRIDKYSSQAFCADKDKNLEHLRKYCYCTKLMK